MYSTINKTMKWKEGRKDGRKERRQGKKTGR